MIIEDLPGYFLHRTIPLRPGSNQAYLMQSLDVRRHQKRHIDDHEWTLIIEQLTRTSDSLNLTFKHEHIRKEFSFRMYGLLSCQFSYVMMSYLIFYNVEELNSFFDDNVWLLYISFGCALFVYLLLLCFNFLRKTRIVNLILITLLVFFLGSGLSALSCIFEIHLFIYALTIQTSVTVFITILAKFEMCDVAGCAMTCCVLGVVFAIYGVVASLIIMLTGVKLLDVALAGIAVTFISLYLMYDTYFIMHDRTLNITPGEYVRGNIHLYVDVVLMFNRFCFAGYNAVKTWIQNK